jgi:hypothetical protein
VLCASVLENRVPSTVSVADPSAVAAVTLELSTRAVRWLWYSKSHVWLPLHAAAMPRVDTCTCGLSCERPRRTAVCRASALTPAF